MRLVLKDTSTNKMILAVENNTEVDIFNGTLIGAPIKNIRLIGGTNEMVDFNKENGKFIVYEMLKDTVIIPDGNLLEIEFDVKYGTFKIELQDVVAVNQDAQEITTDISGGVATMAIRFSPDDLLATIDQILDRDSAGLDLNEDDVVDIVDLQIIINNLT